MTNVVLAYFNLRLTEGTVGPDKNGLLAIFPLMDFAMDLTRRAPWGLPGSRRERAGICPIAPTLLRQPGVSWLADQTRLM